MNTKADPREIATTLLGRSVCSVQVAAVLRDRWGVFAWGWNTMGPEGLGQHAEAHAIGRANRSRLEGATMFVAASRKRNGRNVTAQPCSACWRLTGAAGIRTVFFRNGEGKWQSLSISTPQ